MTLSEIIDAQIEAWKICQRINKYVIESLDETQWKAKAANGRSVQDQFVHLHKLRLMWVKVLNPSVLDAIAPLPDSPEPVHVSDCLRQSAQLIAAHVRDCLEKEMRPKGFKPAATAYLGYLIRQ